ncbi:MAG: VCBS repeat-containing protein, partial [Candidatus Eisenbacteria sp.]|nr:VCBS repeat-containing protein [Candidatus Eisenbacteria bacterium]
YDEGDDGVPDVGETITLTIDILNEGNGEADLVSAELNYPSAEVSITDSLDTWGDIAASAVVSGQTGFVFTVDSAITQKFELVLTDEDGKTWVKNFDVVAPAMPTGLDGRVKATTIYLTWDGENLEDDRWGFFVYRTDHPFGTFERANSAIVEGISYYEDAGLAENQRYYYYVSTVDSSGNEGAHSDTLEINTNPPAQAGWPLMGGEAMYGSPVTADVDLDGDMEVLVGSGEIYAWHHDGVEITDGDGDPRTEGVLAEEGSGGYRSSVAVGQLESDLYPEIVGAAWGNVGGETPTYEVWAWNAEDGTPLGGNWPATTSGKCWATPVLADLDHDGLDEVILSCANGYLYVWSSDGSGFLSPDGIFASLDANYIYSSAAVVDIDLDNDLEILVGSRSDSVYCFNPDGSMVPGWPVNVLGDVKSSVAVGDVNNDGLTEVVVASNSNYVWLFSSDGVVFPNWPQTCVQSDDFGSSATLADLDGDGDLEILIASTDGKIHVWTWEGTVYPGWPQTMVGSDTGDKRGSVSVGDIDGDSDVEIVVGSCNGKVYGYDTDGELLAGWPIQTDGEIFSSPALDDLDLDGDVEVIVSGQDEMVYVWDTEGSYDDGDGVEWGSFRHNSRCTGFYNYELEVGVHDEDGS